MKATNFSILEKVPQLYFATGIGYYLYITILLFINLFTNSTTDGSELRNIVVLLIETIAIIWLVIFYCMNPIRIWKKAKSDMEELFASPKRNIISLILKPDLNNRKKTIKKAFFFTYFQI
ncbi:hypothetical protein [Aquimarina agarivorans]|uniref:hypothetical protein n=1 Tax=Aquimarina agarivorans TaxID=980584 RepID=UPI000248E8D6|nr:hypothetical protein [Aquimarina agarivorans]